MDWKGLRKEERIAAEIAMYFKNRGYEEYRMGAFEEYSVYMENRDFLLSESMAVFAGQDGKLYALRPDVTLSVVKNARTEGGTKKFFYREMVCRLEKGSNSYRESAQIGAEILGEIDRCAEAEIIQLIMKTLSTVNEKYLLDISHMGYVNGLIGAMGAEGEEKEELMRYLKEKNTHDFEKFAERKGIAKEKARIFKEAAAIGGGAEEALKKATELAQNEEMRTAAEELTALTEIMKSLGVAEKININFSIANNADYYNGIIYNGYVDGIPKAVLGGGRYDKLAEKFGKRAQAIGFALYFGELTSYFGREEEQTDVLLLYRDGGEAAALKRAEQLNAEGKSVKLARRAERESCKETEVVE